MTEQSNNKRIAKNTLVLYVRMVFMMLVALYTSRVILDSLGVSDFGIYNVVGGLVSMFNIVSAAISVAISRFITFELGRKDQATLNAVFSSSLILQLGMCVLVVLLGETVGLWFLDHFLSFPAERAYATHVIYQFSILTFCINLISIPYNAAIIAHEHMKAFAYISILEASLKLMVALAIPYVGSDKLVLYGLLLLVVSVVVRVVYGIYCQKHFEECRFRWIFKKEVLRGMYTYAGWTYIGASSALLRDAGGNILVNIFYGPVANAARGIGVQVQQAVSQFTGNFMTALNPQITKNYASGNYDYMKSLVFNGSRLSYYMLLVISLPILSNTPYILGLWLKQVPPYTVEFVRLAVVFVVSESISNPLITAASASGRIKKYQLLTGGIQSLNFPLSGLLLYMGLPPYIIFVVAVAVSQLCLLSRLYILRGMIGLSVSRFWHEVYRNIVVVTACALPVPMLVQPLFPSAFTGLLASCLVCVLSAGLSVLYIGCRKEERAFIYSKTKSISNKLFNKIIR